MRADRKRGVSMRTRMAPIICIAFLAACCAPSIFLLNSGTAATRPHQEHHATWTSSYTPASRSDSETMRRTHYRLITFARAVNTWRVTRAHQIAESFATAEAAVTAATEAQQVASSSTGTYGASSPTSTTTSAPAAYGDSGIPAAWQATAMCEERGEDDPNYGYFGIKEWNGFDGYPSAGSAPISVQLAWEEANGISPPDAPGECHSY